MHAVIAWVRIEEGEVEASQIMLREEVAPRVSKGRGFVKGYWTTGADSTRRMSFVLFDSEEDAYNAASLMQSAPKPRGVILETVEIREILVEA
jgi:hypothetical protein